MSLSKTNDKPQQIERIEETERLALLYVDERVRRIELELQIARAEQAQVRQAITAKYHLGDQDGVLLATGELRRPAPLGPPVSAPAAEAPQA